MKQKKPNHSLAMRIIGAAFLLITLSAQVWAGFEEGEAAFVRGDYTEAHREWMPLAVEGDARAQWGVAHLYLLGLGVMQDVAVSAQWAKKSADQGYVEGLSLLADLYQRGVGVPQDLPKAMELRKRAADTGDALAQYNLALAYLRGEVIQKDANAAIELLRSAASQNFQGAMFNLGVLFFKGEDVPQDFVRSYMWFELAAAWKSGSDGDHPVGSMAELGERASGIQSMLSDHISPEEIAEAQRMARDWAEANITMDN